MVERQPASGTDLDFRRRGPCDSVSAGRGGWRTGSVVRRRPRDAGRGPDSRHLFETVLFLRRPSTVRRLSLTYQGQIRPSSVFVVKDKRGCYKSASPTGLLAKSRRRSRFRWTKSKETSARRIDFRSKGEVVIPSRVMNKGFTLRIRHVLGRRLLWMCRFCFCFFVLKWFYDINWFFPLGLSFVWINVHR